MSSPRSPHRGALHHSLDDSFGSDITDTDAGDARDARDDACSSESEDEVFFGRCAGSDDEAETVEETRARLRCEEQIRARETEAARVAEAAAPSAAAAAVASATALAAAEEAEAAAVIEEPPAVATPPMEEDPAEPEAEPATEADAAGSILTQVRATILKLKQGRSTIGVASGGASGKVTKLSTIAGTSSLPVLRTATSSSRIPTPATSAAVTTPRRAASTAQPAAALTLSRAQPVPSVAAVTPVASQPARPLVAVAPAPAVASVAVPVSASKLSTLASSMQLASPAPMRKSMSVFRTATIQAQVAALNKSTQQQQQIAAAVAAAPPKPVQPAALPSALSARPASASVTSSSANSAAPLLLSARPVSASAAVTSSAAPSAAVNPAALSYRTPARRNVVWRDEDASQSAHLGPLAGQLEEVKFMSPVLCEEDSPQRLGGAVGVSGGLSGVGVSGVATLSQSYAAFTAARARAKPMPDLSKTPTKSCLRRNLQQQQQHGTVTGLAGSASVAAPIMPVPLSYLQGFAATSSAASLDAPIVTPAPIASVTASSSGTSAQRILHPAPSTAGVTHSGVQSGARRVPNLTKIGSSVTHGVASVGAATGAMRTLSLTPSQPTAVAFPSVAAAAGDKSLCSGGVGAAVTSAYLSKRPLAISNSVNTLSSNNSGINNMR